MNPFDEPRDPREEALARALHAEADKVRPVGDGLVRIRSRVERRQSRTRWVMPTAGVAAVAATVTAVVASGVLVGPKRTLQPTAFGPVTLTSASTPTASPAAPRTSAAPSPAPVATTRAAAKVVPSAAPSVTDHDTTAAPTTTASLIASDTAPVGPTPVWPFADAAAATKWATSAAAGDWHLSPVGTAEHFVDGLKLAGVHLTGKPVAVGDESTATVTLQRTSDTGKPVTLAVVQLSHWAAGADAPWGVVSVTNPSLTVSTPTAGAAVSGSVDVAYSDPGTTEAQVDASVFAAGTGAPLAKATPSTPGTVTVAAQSSTAGAGYVVLTETSGGGATPTVGSLAVVPVQLAASPPQASTTPPVPSSATYVALVGGKIEVLDATTGSLVRTLAPAATGVTEVAVSDDRQWVYFLQDGSGCHGTVWRTRFDGTGTAAQFSTYLDGLSTFAVAGTSAPWMSYVYTPCASGAQTLFFFHGAEGPAPQSIGATSRPPDVRTVAISPDGKQASAFVRTGNEGNVWTFDLAVVPTSKYAKGPTMDAHTTPAACTTGVECVGETYAANGDLYLVRSNGTQLEVVRETGTTVTSLFSVAASSQLATIDVDPTGTKVALTDGISKGWLWTGSGNAAPIAGSVTDASW